MTLPDLLGNSCGRIGLWFSTGQALAPISGLGVSPCPHPCSQGTSAGSAGLGPFGSVAGVTNCLTC